MTRRILIAIAALSSTTASMTSGTPLVSSLDASYVVQLHGTRDIFSHPKDVALMRSQFMTTTSGQTFECFLPPLPHFTHETEEIETFNPVFTKENEEKHYADDFLAKGRAAAERMRSECIYYTDSTNTRLYEICVGVMIRRLSVYEEKEQVEATGTMSKTNTAEIARHEVEELGVFVTDTSRSALTYDEFIISEMQDRVKNHLNPLFTQNYGNENQDIQVQFICIATAQNDEVSAIKWREHSTMDSWRDIAAFLVGSQKFCDLQDSEADSNDLVAVRSLLQPLEDAHTCITRNEGWWTYEFCFGRSLRQYHRDSDGRITAEFSLGTFDEEGNRELERLGSALVSEHIDATHDVSRPAYLELYDHGTFCKEFAHHAPRKAKVFYYCSQGGTSHHILMVKETQTCMYTVKVSSPVLCDHPHFLNDEQTSNPAAEILHCIPVTETAVTVTE
ncbi:unnamed protein product [Peronospora belbahrii]|uniref:MRH domain-containing protein n=1 Tax=Peronospora belbahrii TaxID=622444 RepID=A0AAU9KMW4_9STRA|nr:unnamed protein product [Peronospora belbahrii]CAH0514863.1 unnamed protein product [Peronospora belbahrii]